MDYKKIKDFFEGRKTYLLALLLAFVELLKVFDVISLNEAQDQALITVFVAGFAFTFRSAMKR